jgi:hypothetical protein
MMSRGALFGPDVCSGDSLQKPNTSYQPSLSYHMKEAARKLALRLFHGARDDWELSSSCAKSKR